LEQCKNHKFFKGTDWAKMLNKQVKPPINPKVKTEFDVRNFDKARLSEEIISKPGTPVLLE
jgi:hypothetical protein